VGSITVVWAALQGGGQHCCGLGSVSVVVQDDSVVGRIAVFWAALLCCGQHCCVVGSITV
jgi:hypothetical protein